MSEEKKELRERHSRKQEKYVYYIIALSVSALGYSIHQSTGIKLSFYQIPLGVSILCWVTSVWFGIKFLQAELDILYTNSDYFDVVQGNHHLSGDHPEKIEIGEKALRRILEEKIDRAGIRFNWQQRLFFMGILSYIVHHVLSLTISNGYL